MSLISELEEVRSTLKACRKAIELLIRRWQNGEIDTESDGEEESSIDSPSISNIDRLNVSPLSDIQQTIIIMSATNVD